MQIYISLLLPTLNVPLRIGKCTPRGTGTACWEPLISSMKFGMLEMRENETAQRKLSGCAQLRSLEGTNTHQCLCPAGGQAWRIQTRVGHGSGFDSNYILCFLRSRILSDFCVSAAAGVCMVFANAIHYSRCKNIALISVASDACQRLHRGRILKFEKSLQSDPDSKSLEQELSRGLKM